MAIRFVPQPKEEISLERKIITVTVISIFFIVGLVFIFLYYHNVKITGEIAKIEDEIKKSKTPEQISEENFVILYKNKIDNYKKIISNHFFPSRILTLLNSLVDSEVYFTRLDYDKSSLTISLSGVSSSLNSLQRQVSNFEKDNNISSVNINKVGYIFSENKKKEVSFEISFKMKKSFLSQ